jgi:hypothetical protein
MIHWQRPLLLLLTVTMGSNVSKENELVKKEAKSNNENKLDRSNKICIDCQKDKQVDYPAVTLDNDTNNRINGNNDECYDLYMNVDICMKKNQGQISSCVDEWKTFNTCFTQQKQEQGQRR